jgi:hypothetical protein
LRAKVEDGSALGAHQAGRSNSANDSGNDNRNPPRNFLRRLTVNEWLTLLVGVGSLAVSFLTWRTVADTSDIKAAIRNLSDLAVQTERQADAASGELAEMREEQRPWLQVIPAIKGPLTNADGRLTINIGLAIKNTGHAPAVSVRAKAELKSRLLLKYGMEDDPLKSICKSAPNNSWKTFYEDAGYDIVFPGESDVVEVVAAISEDQGMAFKGGLWNFGVKGLGKSPAINLVFCVAYKEIEEDETLHTGGVISIFVPDGGFKDGQSIPTTSLNLERSPFEWRNYAD